MTVKLEAEEIIVFDSFQSWVNKAAARLGGFPKGSIFCVDKNGNRCFIGEDFMAARDNDLFPCTAYRFIRTIEAVQSSQALSSKGEIKR